MKLNTPNNDQDQSFIELEHDIANSGIISSFLYSLHVLEERRDFFNSGTILEEKNAIDSVFNQNHLSDTEAEERVKFHIRSMLNRLVEDFIAENGDIIYLALKTFQYKSEIKYLIILNKDTAANRDRIFNFLMNYYKIPLSINFIIDFQIMPREVE